MQDYRLTPQKTENPAVRKFIANQVLIQDKQLSFSNIKEASAAPLAEKLLAFPFVKTVFFEQNFIAVEISKTVSWEEILHGMLTRITKYLNSGQPLFEKNTSSTKKKVAVTVYAEITPNPMALKLVCNKLLIEGSVQYYQKEDTKHAPFARALFDLPYVRQVFIDRNYLSIMKQRDADWNVVMIELREFVQQYLQENKPVLSRPLNTAKDTVLPKAEAENLSPVSKRIIATLGEYVQPIAASKGGNIKFRAYDSKIKKLEVVPEGAYIYSPSLHNDLKSIEALLKRELPDDIEMVESITRHG